MASAPTFSFSRISPRRRPHVQSLADHLGQPANHQPNAGRGQSSRSRQPSQRAADDWHLACRRLNGLLRLAERAGYAAEGLLDLAAEFLGAGFGFAQALVKALAVDAELSVMLLPKKPISRLASGVAPVRCPQTCP